MLLSKQCVNGIKCNILDKNEDNGNKIDKENYNDKENIEEYYVEIDQG